MQADSRCVRGCENQGGREEGGVPGRGGSTTTSTTSTTIETTGQDEWYLAILADELLKIGNSNGVGNTANPQSCGRHCLHKQSEEKQPVCEESKPS